MKSSIKTVIIDDNKDYLIALRKNLLQIVEIDIIGEASNYLQAKNLLTSLHPDLVFLDIEMPVKNGFELLEELRQESRLNFKVIFYTAYDQYMIDALRQSAFDFILKPAQPDELQNTIERYKDSLNERQAYKANSFLPFNDIVSVPVPVGLRFVDRNQIVYARTAKEKIVKKASWELRLNNFDKIRLRNGITSGNIQNLLGSNLFIPISQSIFVNKNYISIIEYKTRRCILIPPFDDLELPISRLQINDLRNRFDLL
jgi:two-component system, LytTR family, response regulator